ncbi:multicopper oxidase-domain-containing protein [Podospora australis]|uniref:Multicopper oxidase-domain-containing protein n=1 Tax=Podospora australis TaxID=1536484 RepID=A0AAN7AEG3_9PEZI|nr:multicopper oxidase-domain-containing protein [Podospora australis]
MHIIDSLWAFLTYFLSLTTFSPTRDFEPTEQVPLGFPSYSHTTVPPGPIFKPPGGLPDDGGDGSEFICDYSRMIGFRDCSSANHSCWLTNDKGITFDIGTDYDGLNSNGDINMPNGTIRRYNLEVTDGSWFADGVDFTQARLFRDTSKPAAQYPGPWIQACWGDLIQINVTNKMTDNGTSIHWHGIRQWFNMQADGVNGVTQCPMAPGDWFLYSFNATQYGSSWYHSHYTIQYADGLIGPITIHGPSSDDYDIAPEQPILITDWIHNSAFEYLRDDTANNASILLNGVGNVNSFAGIEIVSPSDIPAPYTVNVKRNAPGSKPYRYLLRLINTSFETTFVLSIDNHNMTVVEMDFVPIQPYNTTDIFIGIGQRFDVIVAANAPEGQDDFWIRAIIPEDCTGDSVSPNRTSTYKPSYDEIGIFYYGTADPKTPTSEAWPLIDSSCTDEDYDKIFPVVEWMVPAQPANDPHCQSNCEGERENITTGDNPPDGYPLAFFGLDTVNLSKWTPFRIDYSQPAFLNLNLSRNWTDNELVVPEDYTAQDWVYLTICDVSSAGPHPLHLHGHDFAILQVSNAPCPALDAGDVPLSLRLQNPARRDVVLVPNGGFVVIAFKTDNPGNWLMHCHIAKHAASGLGLQILERREDALKRWPDANTSHAVSEAERVCKNWRAWWPGSFEIQDDSGV